MNWMKEMRWSLVLFSLNLALALTLLACQQKDPSGRPIIFQEYFEGTVSDEWRYAGDYDELLLVGNQLGGPGDGLAQMCVGELDWDDYAVTLWTDHSEGSVVVYFRLQNWDETYGFLIQENVANLFTRYDNDATVHMDSVKQIGEDPVQVQIQVVGDEVNTYIDGDLFHTFQDARLPTGRVCLELAGDVLVDNFVITEP